MNLIDTAKALTAFVEDGIRYGLPEPSSMDARTWHTPVVMCREFADVQAWADYMETEPVTSTRGEVEFIVANGDMADVYGITVQVTTNRPMTAGLAV